MQMKSKVKHSNIARNQLYTKLTNQILSHITYQVEISANKTIKEPCVSNYANLKS